MHPDVSTFVQVLLALVSGGTLYKIADYVLKYNEQRQKSKSDEMGFEVVRRKDVEEQYGRFVDRLQEEIRVSNRQFQQDVKDLNRQLTDTEARNEDRIKDLSDSLVRCEIDREALRGELRLFQITFYQMRGGTPNPLGYAESWGETVLIADHTGAVRECNPAATLLFHYSQEELKRKLIVDLMPPEYRDRHLAGYRTMVEEGKFPDPEKVMDGEILTKEGDRIPVSIQFAAWTSEGKVKCGATIRRRLDRNAAKANVSAALPGLHMLAPIPVVVVNSEPIETHPVNPSTPVISRDGATAADIEAAKKILTEPPGAPPAGR